MVRRDPQVRRAHKVFKERQDHKAIPVPLVPQVLQARKAQQAAKVRKGRLAPALT